MSVSNKQKGLYYLAFPVLFILYEKELFLHSFLIQSLDAKKRSIFGYGLSIYCLICQSEIIMDNKW